MKKTILYIVFAIALLAGVIKVFRPSKTVYGTKAEITVPNIDNTVNNTIKEVTFIIDNSGSMRGYVDFSGNKEQFKDAKKSLLSLTGEFMGNCDTKYHSRTIAFCNGDDENTFNTSQTLDKLSNYTAFGGKTTEVDKLIEMAISHAKGDSALSVVVSDLILSYGKKTLVDKADKYYNLHSLNELQIKVRNEFKRLNEQNKGVLIAKYDGDFNGKYYYNYAENLDDCAFKDSLMKNRPFYFMVIGSENAIKDLCNSNCLPKGYKKIFTSLSLDSTDMKQLHYTVSQPAGQALWILGSPNSKNDSVYAKNTFSLTMTKNIKDAVSKFDFTFDKFDIPCYVSDSLTSNYDTAQLSSVQLIENNQISVATVAFNKLKDANNVRICFTSPRYVDYDSYSTLDDITTSLANMEGKTWGFEALVKALYDAYGIQKDDKHNVLSLDFVINTK